MTSFAGFWRRLGAFLIDSLVLGVPALLAGLAMFRWAADLGQAGRLIGFVVALLYFGLLNSRLGGGHTIGQRLLGIRVIDRDGQPLSPERSMVRFLVIAIPYFLNGLWFDFDINTATFPDYLLAALLIFVVFGGFAAIGYLFVFNRRTRQSLHDLVVGSFVVKDPPSVIPLSFSVAHVHLVVVGCLLTLALIVPLGLYWTTFHSGLNASLTSLLAVQNEIKSRLNVKQVKVSMGTSTVIGSSGNATTSYLLIDAQPTRWEDDLEALQLSIAGTVLDLHPDLLGKKALTVLVRRQFDLGIASWSNSNRATYDAASWREKLRQSGSVRPSKT
jgi:uncharacterized RDD family membrane protein YckC